MNAPGAFHSKRFNLEMNAGGVLTRMFIIWSIFGLVERIMKKTTSLGSESIPNVKNKNFALESFFLMISCKILKRLKNLDLV